MKFIRWSQVNVVKAAVYIWKRVLPFALGLSLLAPLSFVFTGGFTFSLLSERVFYVAILVFLIAGTVAMSHMISGRAIMFPYNIRKPEDAKKFVQDMPSVRAKADQQLDAGIQLWLIGLGCLGISALIQTLFG